MTIPSDPENYYYTLIKPWYDPSNQIKVAAINASGQVVGYTQPPGGYISSDTGFEYANGSLTVIKPPGAVSSLPIAINASGVIVGFYVVYGVYSVFGVFTSGFIDNNGTFTTLGLPGAFLTYVNGINDAGVAIGYSDFGNGVRTSFSYDNKLYSTIAVPGAGATYATGINNSGIVIGTYQVSGSQFQLSGNFIYDHGVYTTIASPGVDATGTDFGFSAINNNNEIIGNTLVGGHRVGFIYNNGNSTVLVAPDATLTNASGINDQGEVVGRFINASGTHAFVYENGSFTQLDVPGALYTEGDAINDRGQVTGTYGDATGEFAFIATPTDDDQGWSFLKNTRYDLNDFQSGTQCSGSEAGGNRAERHDGSGQERNRGCDATPDNDRAGLFSSTHEWHHL